MWWKGDRTAAELCAYVIAQIIGAIAGVWLAHLMFDLPMLQVGLKVRAGGGQWISEAVATVGLLATILLGLRAKASAIPALVGSYIMAAYWFTASTSFANPAVALARSLTGTFAGIRPVDVPGFVCAEVIGTFIVLVALHVLQRTQAARS